MERLTCGLTCQSNNRGMQLQALVCQARDPRFDSWAHEQAVHNFLSPSLFYLTHTHSGQSRVIQAINFSKIWLWGGGGAVIVLEVKPLFLLDKAGEIKSDIVCQGKIKRGNRIELASKNRRQNIRAYPIWAII